MTTLLFRFRYVNFEYIKSYLLRKKTGLIALLIITFSLLWTLNVIWSYINIDYVKTDKLSICIDDRLSKFKRLISTNDFVVIKDGMTKPFTGNGHFGISLGPNSSLFLKHGHSLTWVHETDIVLDINIDSTISQSVDAVNVLDGKVMSLKCFKHDNDLCIPTSSSVWIHRIQPELLVQEIHIDNPSKNIVNIKLVKNTVPNRIIIKEEIYDDKNVIIIELIRNEINSEQNSQSGVDLERNVLADAGYNGLYMLVGYLQPKFIDHIDLDPFEKKILKYQTLVKKSDVPLILPKIRSLDDYKGLVNEVVHSKVTTLANAMSEDLKRLARQILTYPLDSSYKVHTTAWNRLWESGFSITHSQADNTLNGDHYNLTLYYLLAQRTDKLVSLIHADNTGSELFKELNSPMSCSEGPSILNQANLWPQMDSNEKIIRMIDTWRVTLKHRGCESLLSMGPQGFLQAVLYSIGSIRLSTGHVALWLRPTNLHRGITLRNVLLAPHFVYANLGFYFDMDENTGVTSPILHIERSVEQMHRPLVTNFMNITAHNFESMFERRVHIQPSIGPIEVDFLSGLRYLSKTQIIYACPANCEPIQEVGYEKTFIKILMTSPPTAIMHIAVSNSENLNDVSKALHLDQVSPDDRIQHDLLLLHKHGHMLRGLPLIFWISLGFLVFIFHLFLCRLIFSECWQDKTDLELPINSYDSRKRKNSHHYFENFSERMASVYVNSHLANRKAQRKHNYGGDMIP